MFGPSEPKWDAEKCGLELKLALTRMKNYKRKKTEQSEGIKREVAALMNEDKLEQARVRAMALINEDYMFEVLLMAELYCSRILLRLEVIAAQVSCPLDIVEQVYGLAYVAPYLDRVTELIKIRDLFVAKYGPNMLSEAVECKCVSPKVIDLLSRATPSECLIDFYMGTIALNHEIGWEPSGLTPVTAELWDPLIVDEEIDETTLPLTAQQPPPTPYQENASLLLDISAPETFPQPTTAGTLRVDKSSNFWVVDEDPRGPIFIPQDQTSGARPGDQVIVLLDARPDGKRSGVIQSTILDETPFTGTPPVSAPPQGLICILKQDKNGNFWALNQQPTGETQTIFIPPHQVAGAKDGDNVRVVLQPRPDGKLLGEVLSVL